MTVAKISQAEPSEDLESSVAGLESEKRPEDELESDVDHKEMIRTYACDAYLSRWLPSIKDEQILDGPSMSSHIEETKPVEEPKERRGTTSQQSETSLKSPLKHQEADVSASRDTKVSHENGRKTYFEAIKCSPMKLRQSIASHKRPKIEDSLVMKPHHNNQTEENVPTAKSQANSCVPEMAISTLDQPGSLERLTTKHFQEKTVPTAKSQMSPCVVEMTKDAFGQLGSLCFQAKNPDRRRTRTHVVYTSCHITGGKTRRVHRNSTNTVTCGKNNGELLVPCESIMIYPKVLVSPRNEKVSTKPVRRKEAWREDCLGESVLAKNNPDDYTKLPELGPKESVPLLDEKCERKELPEFVKNSQEKHRANSQNSQTSASTKIIIPFGEHESKLANEGKLERLASQKEELLLTKPFHDTNVSFKDKNSQKKRACFPENQKGRYTNFPKRSTRTISGIVVGVSQLEIPCKTPLVTQSMVASTASSPLKRFRIRTEDASELSLGRENPSPKKTVPRFSYGQRTRPDFCGTAKRCSSVMTEDQEGYKYFLNTDGILSLKIGGTGLLKEQKSSQEDLGGEKHTEDVDKKRIHFNALVPHSRYFT